MPEEVLKEVAEQYNARLREFVEEHNTLNRGTHWQIFNLSQLKEVDALRKLGYGVDVFAIEDMSVFENPYIWVEKWVDEHLKAQDVDYDPSVTRPVNDNFQASYLVQSAQVQRGLCVVGKNEHPDSEFEVHLYGREVLSPWFFDGFTMITKGFDHRQKTIDRSTAVLIYMPADVDLVYVLDQNAGHYAPHGISVMEVDLPYGTNGDILTELEEKVMNKYGNIFIARNKILASDRGAQGTVAMLVGVSEVTRFINQWESILDKEIRPTLVERLGHS